MIDIRKLKQKYYNKRVNANKEGIEFFLTFEEFKYLMEKAGLTVDDLGFTGKNYVLARYNDSGPYSINNCRFITQYENYHEKKITKAEKENGINAINLIRNTDEFKQKQKNGYKRWLDDYRNNIVYKRRQEKFNKKHPSYRGSKNSQFGKHWYTNGKVNLSLKSSEDIPFGFYRGRTIK